VTNKLLLISLSRMNIDFYKYQGTGNDFVIIDNRNESFPKKNIELISQMCNRRFGIGADGLILLESHATLDFTMYYFNADGNPGSMCGNGGRCIVRFAEYLNIIKDQTTFEAIDGMHNATLDKENVSLKMNDVSDIKVSENYIYLDTGSPHHVQLVDDLENYNVKKEGAAIRCTTYGKAGANINFVERIDQDKFAVRTYERGVEDETLSCGTGVTAVAIALYETNKTSSNKVILYTKGGLLNVNFSKTETGYNDVYLKGPASQVFKGIWQ